MSTDKVVIELLVETKEEAEELTRRIAKLAWGLLYVVDPFIHFHLITHLRRTI